MSRKRRRRRTRRNQLFSKGSPLWMLLLCLTGAALAAVLIIYVLAPWLRHYFVPEVPDAPISVQTAKPTLDMTDRIREILFSYRYKNASMPAIVGDTIFFSAGSDNAGNPKLAKIYSLEMESSNATISPPEVPGIEAQHHNILSVDANEAYLVYFDANASGGGGTIFAYDRQTQEVIKLKEVWYGSPEPKLAGNAAIWLERTGETQEKLYMMQIETQELITLEVFEDTSFGLSLPGVCETEVVWAVRDTSYTDGRLYGIMKILNLETGVLTTYNPGMYIHAPVTNGTARAWAESSSTNATLYLSYEGTRPQKIADNVSAYGMGEDFLAWTENGQVFVYYYETGDKAFVSKATELSQLVEVSGKAIAWINMTAESRYNDVIKFAVLD